MAAIVGFADARAKDFLEGKTLAGRVSRSYNHGNLRFGPLFRPHGDD